MEEITTDAASTMESLPSLETATESLPTDAILAVDGPFTTTTEPTDTLVPQTSAENDITTSDAVAVTATFTTTTTTVMETSDIPTDNISCDMSEEVQNDEDPSVAIDQFIKKIADEQLSGKQRSVSEEDIAEKNISENIDDMVEEKPHENSENQPEANVEQETQSAPQNEEEPEKNEEIAPVTPEENTEVPILETVASKEPELNLDSAIVPSEVSKDPALILEAQEEIKKTDVLVCGICHSAFHFIEEFQDHKSRPCEEKSGLVPLCENESKPQVWGFTLWKVKQSRNLKEGEKQPSSWTIYQRWCKLPQLDKNSWITAGQTMQFCSKIGNAKVTEIKSKNIKSVPSQDSVGMEYEESNKENSTNLDEKNSTATELIKRGIIKPVKLNNDVTILPSNKNDANTNKAIRTTKILSTQKQEYAVEKIVAKRFNPRRKMWEYQIKWETFGSESNTWEPVSNLSHCKQMLERFEEQLRKIKEEKAKQAAASALVKSRGRPQKSASQDYAKQAAARPNPSNADQNTTPGRPQRSSKQKAMDQVKAWCGSMSDNEDGSLKRLREDDDDSDDSFEKKMKYEDYSDDSDAEIKPKGAHRKSISKDSAQIKVLKNGVAGSGQQILPQNILIPDANGVVRINQKQLPSLSTGVYIMSKTAGIIKLDSSTSKVATSGGQTIVKVAPKIGQTQIRIVKKDGGLTKQIIQVSPKTTTPSNTKTTTTVTPKGVNKPGGKPGLGKPKRPEATRIIVKQKEEPKYEPDFDDSDDGIEPLEFPTDLPLPEPESPPGDFTLDPFTGKIAGQEYPEIEPMKDDQEDANNSVANELENIVKLAAADITEDDLKSDSMETEETHVTPIITKEHHGQKTTMEVVRTAVSSPTVTTRIINASRPTIPKSEPSILNRALTGTNMIHKNVITPSPQRKIQQRVLNQSVTARPHLSTTKLVQPSPQGAIIRARPVPPRQKYNITKTPTRVQQPFPKVSPANKVQVYSNKANSAPTRKIGNTFIRSTSTPNIQPRPPAKIVQTMYRTSPKKSPLVVRSNPSVIEQPLSPAKRTVINMPSLTDDEPTFSTVRQGSSVASSIIVKGQSPVKGVKLTENSQIPLESPSEGVCIASVDVNKEQLVEPVAEAVEGTTDLSSFTLADNDNPIFITGDDGTVYQVAGQNEQGQTILITQGADGQQQCLLVTNEVSETATEEAPTALAEAPVPEIQPPATDVREPLEVKTDTEVDAGDQVVAQVVRAEPPSPGGTHKVVVMLPDGNLMVTQVSPEEYASLELE